MASHRGATWQWRDEEAQEDDEDDSAGKEEENSEEDRESSGEDENENEKDSKRQKSDDADLPLYLRVRNKELDSEIASSGTTRTRKLRKLKSRRSLPASFRLTNHRARSNTSNQEASQKCSSSHALQ
jgi:hypothetical protein